MGWVEFSDLLSGIGPDTPLAQVARVRTERDPERVRAMTAGQRAIRAEWARRQAGRRDPAQAMADIEAMQAAFAEMFG